MIFFKTLFVFNLLLLAIGGTHFGRGENPVVFNGTTKTTKLLERIEITGNLCQKKCTTVFYNVNKTHADKYFFRIEMNSFKATFKEPFNLTVEDTTVSPRISELSEVSEGTSVTLTCTAAAPCPSQPPTITWSLPTGNISTHIQDEENGNRSLTTLPPPVSPADVVASVSPSGPAAEGSSVTLTCNSEANPPVQNYTWFRKDQDTPIGSGQTLTFNLSSSDEGLYYCRAEHPQGGKDSAAVRLEIKGRCFKIALSDSDSETPLQDEQCVQHKDSGVCTVESVLTSASKPSEDLQDQILYGEIDFSKRPLRGSSKRTGQKQGQEQESVYAEVHLSGTDAQARNQEAPDTEDLYAQVKRK
ncbi:sialic acid-binding Ig-like lectin 10 [Sardina pilchardus]|uniref:sialic acid-binding Ig-like lectin 10 n=1 Tax=Sardina pilchardus TaxID=27697 RepID=UPI002E0FB5D2